MRRQTPTAGPTGAAALTTRGKDIYQNGDSAAGIPPCGACHGAAAAGTDNYPRLAPPARPVSDKAIALFPVNNMRDVAVMHGVARGLKLDVMQAVATYLQSLGP